MDFTKLPAELRLEIWEWTIACDEPAIYFFNRMVDADNRLAGRDRSQWWALELPASDDDADDSDQDAEDDAATNDAGDHSSPPRASTHAANPNSTAQPAGSASSASANPDADAPATATAPVPAPAQAPAPTPAPTPARRRTNTRHYPTKPRSVLIPFPVGMHVCAESRAAISRRLTFRSVQYPTAGRCLLDVPCRAFRPDLDAVYVPEWEQEELPHSFSYGTRFDPGFYKNIRRLALMPDFIARGWQEDIADALPALDTIAIVPQVLGHRDISRCLVLQLGPAPTRSAAAGDSADLREPDVTLVPSNLVPGRRRCVKTFHRMDTAKLAFDPFLWRV